MKTSAAKPTTATGIIHQAKDPPPEVAGDNVAVMVSIGLVQVTEFDPFFFPLVSSTFIPSMVNMNSGEYPISSPPLVKAVESIWNPYMVSPLTVTRLKAGVPLSVVPRVSLSLSIPLPLIDIE